jgi:hypothetical protein
VDADQHHGPEVTSAEAFTVLAPPQISGLTPDVGVLGQTVTVSGAHFGSSQGGSTVTFNGSPASVLTWTDTALQAVVPPGTTSGPVVVTVHGQASNAMAFTVVAEVISYYHTDAIGSVRMTTDSGGNVLARYDYLPFGQPWPSDQDPEPRRFAGMERDLPTGSGSWEALDYFGGELLQQPDRAVHGDRSGHPGRPQSGGPAELESVRLCPEQPAAIRRS